MKQQVQLLQGARIQPVFSRKQQGEQRERVVFSRLAKSDPGAHVEEAAEEIAVNLKNLCDAGEFYSSDPNVPSAHLWFRTLCVHVLTLRSVGKEEFLSSLNPFVSEGLEFGVAQLVKHRTFNVLPHFMKPLQKVLAACPGILGESHGHLAATLQVLASYDLRLSTEALDTSQIHLTDKVNFINSPLHQKFAEERIKARFEECRDGGALKEPGASSDDPRSSRCPRF
jgi:hypothetical protein